MTTETNGQQAKKSFMITVDGSFTAEEMQTELNEWLQAQYAPTEPPPTAKVKQVLDAGYVSQEESEQAIVLLEKYVATALPYQHPMQLLYDFATDYGDSESENLGDGFWDWQAMIKGFIRFFLQPEQAAAFKEMVGDNLSRVLPDLLQFFTDLASSEQVDAALEAVRYERYRLRMDKKRHDRVMKVYSSKLQTYQTEQAA